MQPDPAPGDAGAVDAVGDAAIDAPPDVDNGAPSDVYPAPHLPLPTVTLAGGPLLTTPRVVPIFFPGYTLATPINDMLSKLGASSYWSAAVGEYGVGPITALPGIELTEAAPATITNAAIETWLAGKLDGTHAEFGTPDPSTIYVVYYPASTTFSLGTAKSCGAVYSYHSAIDVGGKTYAYAAIAQCPPTGSLSTLDTVTLNTSVSLIDTATDPFAGSSLQGGYETVDQDHLAWEIALHTGELASMCYAYFSSQITPPDLGYLVGRSWSNAAAMASHDPCAPAVASQPYFNSIPHFDKYVAARGQRTKGIKIPVGATATIDIDLFSEGKTSGPWDVGVMETLDATTTDPNLELSLDRGSGTNGEKLHLTIKVLKAPATKVETFTIVSQLGSQQVYSYGLVVN